MRNPYQCPATSIVAEDVCPEYSSLFSAATAGFQTAVHLMAIVFAPMVGLGFVGAQLFFVARGAVAGKWPEYNSGQFWYSTVIFAILLIVAFLVACACAGLFVAVVYSLRHIARARRAMADA